MTSAVAVDDTLSLGRCTVDLVRRVVLYFGGIFDIMLLEVFADHLSDRLGGRAVLKGAQIFKSLFLNRINKNRESRSFLFHRPFKLEMIIG